MGRPKRIDPAIRWELQISQRLANKVEKMLQDPVTNKPMQGARSRFVEALILDAMKQIENGEAIYDPLSKTLRRKRPQDRSTNS